MPRALLEHATSGAPAEIVLQARKAQADHEFETQIGVLAAQGIAVWTEPAPTEYWLVQRRGALVIRETKVDEDNAQRWIASGRATERQ
jgi:hypothetical protein